MKYIESDSVEKADVVIVLKCSSLAELDVKEKIVTKFLSKIGSNDLTIIEAIVTEYPDEDIRTNSKTVSSMIELDERSVISLSLDYSDNSISLMNLLVDVENHLLLAETDKSKCELLLNVVLKLIEDFKRRATDGDS